AVVLRRQFSRPGRLPQAAVLVIRRPQVHGAAAAEVAVIIARDGLRGVVAGLHEDPVALLDAGRAVGRGVGDARPDVLVHVAGAGAGRDLHRVAVLQRDGLRLRGRVGRCHARIDAVADVVAGDADADRDADAGADDADADGGRRAHDDRVDRRGALGLDDHVA